MARLYVCTFMRYNFTRASSMQYFNIFSTFGIFPFHVVM